MNLQAFNALGLDKFLKSIGRDPAYIDLEANPPVGKDQPPDLAAFVPSGSTVLPDLPESSQDSSGNHCNAGNSCAEVEGVAKAVKPSGDVQKAKEKSVNGVRPTIPSADAEKLVEELLDRTSALLLSEISDDSIKRHGAQLGAEVANSIKKTS